jgi:glucose-6-phosphate isomerase, archaeal
MWSSIPYDVTTGLLAGHEQEAASRRLSDLQGVFADPEAYARALAAGDPILYTVTAIAGDTGPGQLLYALGILYPGKVGDEYYMTKGHFHAWRPAAEVYIGLRGSGMMLLEDEHTGACTAVALAQDTVVYVPGHTAHRTINIGSEPLVYWGVLDSGAGHDYGAVAATNFRHVVVERDGQPVVLERATYLAMTA